jgi:hypothetical protein
MEKEKVSDKRDGGKRMTRKGLGKKKSGGGGRDKAFEDRGVAGKYQEKDVIDT